MKQLARMAATYNNLDEWKARAATVRRQILTGSKLSPLPQRTPLKPIINNKRIYKGYTVEAAVFEARPGFFVYGSLYPTIGFQGQTPGHPVPTRACPKEQHSRRRPVAAGSAESLRHPRTHGRGSVFV